MLLMEAKTQPHPRCAPTVQTCTPNPPLPCQAVLRLRHAAQDALLLAVLHLQELHALAHACARLALPARVQGACSRECGAYHGYFCMSSLSYASEDAREAWEGYGCTEQCPLQMRTRRRLGASCTQHSPPLHPTCSRSGRWCRRWRRPPCCRYLRAERSSARGSLPKTMAWLGGAAPWTSRTHALS